MLLSRPITMYNLPTKEAYIAFVKKLDEVRIYNFKVKRTVQRFLRNKMAKFLNTDRQIIQEIGDLTNANVR